MSELNHHEPFTPERLASLRSIGERFAKSVPERLEQLASALHDPEELLHLCHKLKGTAGAFGWKDLAAKTADLESLAFKLKAEPDGSRQTEIIKSLQNTLKTMEIVTKNPPDLNCEIAPGRNP